MRMRRRNLWLCLPLAVTGAGDGILTLVGNNITGIGWGWETNPTWRWFLHLGALAFGLAFVGYLVVVGMVVVYAPLRCSKVLCVTMVLAHTHGIRSWLHLAGVRYFFDPLLYATMAVITVVAVEQSRSTEPGDDVAVPKRTPPAPGR